MNENDIASNIEYAPSALESQQEITLGEGPLPRIGFISCRMKTWDEFDEDDWPEMITEVFTMFFVDL